MNEQTPRQRLAEAVKAVETLQAAPEYEQRAENVAWIDCMRSARAELLAAARALLDAPDDAAELAAVKALGYWRLAGGWFRRVGWDGCQWTAIQFRTPRSSYARHVADNPLELCAKLGIEVKHD